MKTKKATCNKYRTRDIENKKKYIFKLEEKKSPPTKTRDIFWIKRYIYQRVRNEKRNPFPLLSISKQRGVKVKPTTSHRHRVGVDHPRCKNKLSYDIVVIQWIMSCHKRSYNNTLARTRNGIGNVPVYSVFLETLLISKATKPYFKGSYGKQNLTLVISHKLHETPFIS